MSAAIGLECAGERQVSKPGRQIAYNQELFAKGLATYHKVIDANSLAHRKVQGLPNGVLMAEAPGRFVFTDLACGMWPEA
jgi:hypothetical protein